MQLKRHGELQAKRYSKTATHKGLTTAFPEEPERNAHARASQLDCVIVGTPLPLGKPFNPWSLQKVFS